LHNAARVAACHGDSKRVLTMVAMLSAASRKPLRKSNTSAAVTATSRRDTGALRGLLGSMVMASMTLATSSQQSTALLTGSMTWWVSSSHSCSILRISGP